MLYSEGYKEIRLASERCNVQPDLFGRFNLLKCIRNGKRCTKRIHKQKGLPMKITESPFKYGVQEQNRTADTGIFRPLVIDLKGQGCFWLDRYIKKLFDGIFDGIFIYLTR